MDKNKKTWKEAVKLIPNGNLFLSKNPNRFLKITGQHILQKAKVVKFGI